MRADEPQAAQRLTDTADLPSPQDFADLVDAEARGEADAAEHSSLAAHAAYEAVAAMTTSARDHLRERMRELARKASELEQRDESWMNKALYDIRGGRANTWIARATTIRELINSVQPAADALGASTEVTVTEGADIGALTVLAAQLHAHVAANGPIKTNPDGAAKIGAFTARTIKAARPLFDAVRVNRQMPVTEQQLTAFLAHADGERQLDLLDKAWPSGVHIPAEDTLRERLQWHRTELEQLGRLLALGHEFASEEQRLADSGLPRPDWNDIAGVLTYARLVDAAAARDAAAEAARPLELLGAATGAVSTWADAAATSHGLHAAVTGRDRDRYAAEHARLLRLLDVRSLAAERDELTRTVRDTAPDLVDAVTADPHAAVWDERITTLPAAWDWARTGAWILEQDTTDTNVLQAQIGHIEGRLRREVEVLAATRAWKHAVSPSRLTGQSRADLTQYAQLVKSGSARGTGKYANAKRTEIRGAMDRCRPAVPVWIMPIYRIAEQLRITQNMFDVVIVDEASQAGLEATFLQYLAPKIVVIGDDKQVSPTAVGVDQQQLRDLANQYLFDDRYMASWQDPKRSLFDEANMRFGSKLTLVEHRRCVPEIIGFSNRIAYEPDNIRLDPGATVWRRSARADQGRPRQGRLREGLLGQQDEPGRGGRHRRPDREMPGRPALRRSDLRRHLPVRGAAGPRYRGGPAGVRARRGVGRARPALRRRRRLPGHRARRRVPVDGRGARGGPAARRAHAGDVYAAVQRRRLPRQGPAVGVPLDHPGPAVATRRICATTCSTTATGSLDAPATATSRGLGAGARGRPQWSRSTPCSSSGSTTGSSTGGSPWCPSSPQAGTASTWLLSAPRADSRSNATATPGMAPTRTKRDLARQRDLERCGWQFFRIRESAFYVDQHAVLAKLWSTLQELDIRPSGWLEEDLGDDPDTDDPDTYGAGSEETAAVARSEDAPVGPNGQFLIGEQQPPREDARSAEDQLTCGREALSSGLAAAAGGTDSAVAEPGNRFRWRAQEIDIRETDGVLVKAGGEPALPVSDDDAPPSVPVRMHANVDPVRDPEPVRNRTGRQTWFLPAVLTLTWTWLPAVAAMRRCPSTSSTWGPHRTRSPQTVRTSSTRSAELSPLRAPWSASACTTATSLAQVATESGSRLAGH